MSKTISYSGTLDMGTQDKIKLSTLKGKIGYKITKFQLMPTAPGTANYEYVGKISSNDQTGSIGTTINFTDSTLLAAIYQPGKSSDSISPIVTIFDNKIFNQDIFVNITDASGATNPCNYYIELKTMKLTDIETTMLTLQNNRTITAPTGAA